MYFKVWINGVLYKHVFKHLEVLIQLCLGGVSEGCWSPLWNRFVKLNRCKQTSSFKILLSYQSLIIIHLDEQIFHKPKKSTVLERSVVTKSGQLNVAPWWLNRGTLRSCHQTSICISSNYAGLTRFIKSHLMHSVWQYI